MEHRKCWCVQHHWEWANGRGDWRNDDPHWRQEVAWTAFGRANLSSWSELKEGETPCQPEQKLNKQSWVASSGTSDSNVQRDSMSLRGVEELVAGWLADEPWEVVDSQPADIHLDHTKGNRPALSQCSSMSHP